MLVLTRRQEQWIQVGDGVTVKVLGVKRDGRVVLGITAPPDVLVLRGPEHTGPHAPAARAPGVPGGPASPPTGGGIT